jgi:hypothetical protein
VTAALSIQPPRSSGVLQNLVSSEWFQYTSTISMRLVARVRRKHIPPPDEQLKRRDAERALPERVDREIDVIHMTSGQSRHVYNGKQEKRSKQHVLQTRCVMHLER